jgi:hypothetical protein
MIPRAPEDIQNVEAPILDDLAALARVRRIAGQRVPPPPYMRRHGVEHAGRRGGRAGSRSARASGVVDERLWRWSSFHTSTCAGFGGRRVTAGSDATARVWDLITGAPHGAPLAGHTGSVYAVMTMVLADGQSVAVSGGSDHTVRLWISDSTQALTIGCGCWSGVCPRASPRIH